MGAVLKRSAALLGGLALFSGCARLDHSELLVLPIVAAEVPPLVLIGEPFFISATVTLPDGCVSFAGFTEDEAEAGRVVLTARGVRDNAARPCLDEPAEIGVEHEYTAPEVGTLIVEVAGSTGTITRRITVQ